MLLYPGVHLCCGCRWQGFPGRLVEHYGQQEKRQRVRQSAGMYLHVSKDAFSQHQPTKGGVEQMRNFGRPVVPEPHDATPASAIISERRSMNRGCHHTRGSGLFASIWKLPRIT